MPVHNSILCTLLEQQHDGDTGWKASLLEMFADDVHLIQEQAAQFDLPDSDRERPSMTPVYQLGYFAAQDQLGQQSSSLRGFLSWHGPAAVHLW